MSSKLGAPATPTGLGSADAPEPHAGLGPSGAIPSAERKPNITCPDCGKGMFVEAAGVVGKDQRMSITVHPLPGKQMIQAEALGGQIVDLDKLMREIAKQDGGKVRTYVEHIGMTDDGGFEFRLAVLPIRDRTKPKQAPLPLAEAGQ